MSTALNVTAFSTQLKTVDPVEIPLVLDAINKALEQLIAGNDKVVPFLTKWCPQLVTGDLAIANALKGVVDFLSAFEVKYMPYILKAIGLINAFFPALMSAGPDDITLV